MRVLDLFCGAGGCSEGYHRAGLDVVGVDINLQKRYPFEFHQADALEYLAEHGHEFDVIHASPPCQEYSVTKAWHDNNNPDLVGPVRELLTLLGKPYVIENVPGAPLVNPLMLCGTMFDLRVIRHRLFECDPAIWFPPAQCHHWGSVAPAYNCTIETSNQHEFMAVVGHFANVKKARVAMGIDWMTQKELAQAIPPAYTEFIGRRLMELL